MPRKIIKRGVRMNIEESIEILENSKCLYLKEKIDSDIAEKILHQNMYGQDLFYNYF